MDRFINIALPLAVVLLVAYFVLLHSDNVSGAEARRLVQNGARLVDVRSPTEFAAGHIQGAINIPVQDLERRITELEPLHDPIVLYCRSGNRSGRASRLLKRAGYSDVHDLGSISRW